MPETLPAKSYSQLAGRHPHYVYIPYVSLNAAGIHDPQKIVYHVRNCWYMRAHTVCEVGRRLAKACGFRACRVCKA